jgi:hypothetical protein
MDMSNLDEGGVARRRLGTFDFGPLRVIKIRNAWLAYVFEKSLTSN